MKQQVRTTVVFTVMIAVASGLTGAFASDIFVNNSIEGSSLGSTGSMMGHVTMFVTGADGSILSYVQSDNIIVDQGEDCALKLLFGGNGTFAGTLSTGTTACGSLTSDTRSFNIIGIGNQTDGTDTALSTDAYLEDEHDDAGSGFERAVADSIVFTSAAGGSSANVVLEKQFTNTDPGTTGSMSVTESALFNSTSTLGNDDGVFAVQTFDAVVVDKGEALTVQWTINIGGTANALGGSEET